MTATALSVGAMPCTYFGRPIMHGSSRRLAIQNRGTRESCYSSWRSGFSQVGGITPRLRKAHFADSL